MTIAVGVRAHNGVVIAADSEESWDYFKFDDNKVRQVFVHHGTTKGPKTFSCSMTGSGGSHYLRAVHQHISNALITASPTAFMDDIESLIQVELIKFYDKHIVPFPSERFSALTDFDLIIGATNGLGHGLWSTELNSVTRRHGVLATGSGGSYARMVLEQLWPEKDYTDVANAAILAAFAIFCAKQSRQYCGKNTQINCLSKGRIVQVSGPEIKTLDELFGEHLRTERSLFESVFTIETKKVRPGQSAAVKKIKDRLTDQLNTEPKKPEINIWLAPPADEK